MLRLWTDEEEVDFGGDYYKAKGAVLKPKPIQRPYPPLWFGTRGFDKKSLLGEGV